MTLVQDLARLAAAMQCESAIRSLPETAAHVARGAEMIRDGHQPEAREYLRAIVLGLGRGRRDCIRDTTWPWPERRASYAACASALAPLVRRMAVEPPPWLYEKRPPVELRRFEERGLYVGAWSCDVINPHWQVWEISQVAVERRPAHPRAPFGVEVCAAFPDWERSQLRLFRTFVDEPTAWAWATRWARVLDAAVWAQCRINQYGDGWLARAAEAA